MSHRKAQENKRRLEALAEKTGNHYYGSGSFYDERKGRYIRLYRGNKWLKVHCKRITRRKLKDDKAIYNRGQYKKLYDYWWELY